MLFSSELARADVATILAAKLPPSALALTCSGLILASSLCLISERGGSTDSTREDVFGTASFDSF